MLVLFQALCKLYYMVQAMSYAASICILTVISIERYFAILHPFRSKILTTFFLLRVVVCVIWAIATGCGVPFLIFYDTVGIPNAAGETVYFCVNTYRHVYDQKAYVVVNFIIWYLIPLILMIIMYSKICVVLWNSSRKPRLENVGMASNRIRMDSTRRFVLTKPLIRRNSMEGSVCGTNGSMYPSSPGCRDSADEGLPVQRPVLLSNQSVVSDDTDDTRRPSTCDSLVYRRSSDDTDAETCVSGIDDIGRDSLASDRLPGSYSCSEDGSVPPSMPRRPMPFQVRNLRTNLNGSVSRTTSRVRFSDHNIDRGERSLLQRRRVIRLLIAVIITFAICVIPNHTQMLWQTFNKTHSVSFGRLLLPPITYLIYYMNSALNPLLYAFLSENFRKSMTELFKRNRGRRYFGTSGRRRSTLSFRTGNTVM